MLRVRVPSPAPFSLDYSLSLGYKNEVESRYEFRERLIEFLANELGPFNFELYCGYADGDPHVSIDLPSVSTSDLVKLEGFLGPVTVTGSYKQGWVVVVADHVEFSG